METVSGKGSATASLVLGILSIVFVFLGITLLALICGIVGLVCANKAKKAGYSGGVRTAGFIVSIVGLSFAGIILLSITSCAMTGANLLQSFGL